MCGECRMRVCSLTIWHTWGRPFTKTMSHEIESRTILLCTHLHILCTHIVLHRIWHWEKQAALLAISSNSSLFMYLLTMGRTCPIGTTAQMAHEQHALHTIGPPGRALFVSFVYSIEPRRMSGLQIECGNDEWYGCSPSLHYTLFRLRPKIIHESRC